MKITPLHFVTLTMLNFLSFAENFGFNESQLKDFENFLKNDQFKDVLKDLENAKMISNGKITNKGFNVVQTNPARLSDFELSTRIVRSIQEVYSRNENTPEGKNPINFVTHLNDINYELMLKSFVNDSRFQSVVDKAEKAISTDIAEITAQEVGAVEVTEVIQEKAPVVSKVKSKKKA